MRGRKNNCCHSEPGAKPVCVIKKTLCHSEPGRRSGEEPALKAAPLPFLLALLFLLSIMSSQTSAQTSQDLLATGHVDQALQTLEQQIRVTPTAEAYNLLCRAHFELGAWDAGISACEKATALEPSNGLYHLWLGRAYGEKADRAGFLKAAGLAKKVRTEFERAVELNPSDPSARTDLAEFYIEAPRIGGGGKSQPRGPADCTTPLGPAMS